jgi:hypothetical protein
VRKERQTDNVGSRGTFQRKEAPEIWHPWGRHLLSVMAPSPPNRFAFREKVSEEKIAISYSPRGDFQSTVKMHEVKLRHSSTDRAMNSVLPYTLGVFLPFVFFTKVLFPDLYI